MYSHALPKNSLVDVYRIERLLSCGPFGLTYFGTDTEFNAAITIREFLPISLATRNDQGRIVPLFPDGAVSVAAAVRRFLEAHRTLGAIRHPNLVRMVRLFEANGTAYLVTEYEPGVALGDWANVNGRPDPKKVSVWLATMADALAALHAEEITHGGVQPGRIRIRNDGTPVLLDSVNDYDLRQDSFAQKIVLADPGFSPPEQYWTSAPRGPWSDLYSLAAVGYWLITGERPIEAPARAAGMPMTRLCDHPKRGQTSAALVVAIDAGLYMDPRQRPRTTSAWRQLLSSDLSPGESRLGEIPVAPVVTPGSGTTGVGWPPSQDRVEALQKNLSAEIGPIATLIIKRAYGKCSDWRNFCELVAQEISDPAARAAFRGRFSDEEPAGVPLPTKVFSSDMLSALEARLAQHIGATAKIIVVRSAKKATTEAELYNLLATEIRDAAAARDFLSWTDKTFHRR